MSDPTTWEPDGTEDPDIEFGDDEDADDNEVMAGK